MSGTDVTDLNACSLYVHSTHGSEHDGVAVVLCAPGRTLHQGLIELATQHRLTYEQVMMRMLVDAHGFTALPASRNGLELLFDPAVISALQLTGARQQVWPSTRYDPVPIRLDMGWRAVYRSATARGPHLAITHDLSQPPDNYFYQGPFVGATDRWLSAARRLGTVTIVCGVIVSIVPDVLPGYADVERAARQGLVAALRVPVRLA